eukprot:sb/3462085/
MLHALGGVENARARDLQRMSTYRQDSVFQVGCWELEKMPQFLRKGPSKKEAYVPKGTVEKPLENSESLRYKALENKVFYFDFKNTGTAAWLEKEIRKLGGRVEYFFGKDVHYLITDKPQTRDSLPPSPFSTAGPSPFSRPDTSQSRCEAGPSVGPSEWAYSEQWKKPTQSSQRSRASKMMEMASVTKSQGSCDMFARAKERGTAIKTVEQITSWLHTVHKKLGTKMSRDSLKEPAKNPSRKLRGQYMKIEDSSRKYKPQVLEDTASWQVMDLNTLSDDSPFNTKQRAARKAGTKIIIILIYEDPNLYYPNLYYDLEIILFVVVREDAQGWCCHTHLSLAIYLSVSLSLCLSLSLSIFLSLSISLSALSISVLVFVTRRPPIVEKPSTIMSILKKEVKDAKMKRGSGSEDGIYRQIEDSSRKYKPQVLEDTASWQVMDLNTLSDDSPFNTKQRAARKAVEKPSTIMSILKKEVKDAKMKSKRPLVLRRKGGGKCEGCNVRFEDLESHLAGDQHGKYAKKDKHFEQIDQLISEGLNLDTFLMDLRSRKKSAVDNVSLSRAPSLPELRAAAGMQIPWYRRHLTLCRATFARAGKGLLRYQANSWVTLCYVSIYLALSISLCVAVSTPSNPQFPRKVATLKGTLSPRSDGSTDTLDVAEGPCTRSRRQKISNMPSPAVTASVTAIAPSPKLPGGALSDLPGELENNYYLRSTPRKLAVLLDQWDSTWDVLPTPENQSQASVVSDGTWLQCRSIEPSSSQAGQVEDFRQFARFEHLYTTPPPRHQYNHPNLPLLLLDPDKTQRNSPLQFLAGSIIRPLNGRHGLRKWRVRRDDW